MSNTGDSFGNVTLKRILGSVSFSPPPAPCFLGVYFSVVCSHDELICNINLVSDASVADGNAALKAQA